VFRAFAGKQVPANVLKQDVVKARSTIIRTQCVFQLLFEVEHFVRELFKGRELFSGHGLAGALEGALRQATFKGE
jgi:hypothetical protein